MRRFSFTITALRSSQTIKEFKPLLKRGLFQGIEIFYPYQLDEHEQERYTNDIKKLIEGLDIEVVLHLPHGGFDNDLVTNSNAMLRMFNAIDYGQIFNVKKYTLHLGSNNDEKAIKTSYRNVRRLCKYASVYNANIMIENMPTNSEVASTLEELKYIFEKVNMDNCKLIYDTGHGHVSYKNTEMEVKLLTELRKYLYHFHISDNDSSRDAHGRIGSGNIEFEKIFSCVQPYDELYCLEILYNNASDLENYYNDLVKILDNINTK